MIALRCAGKHGQCQKVLAYQKENNVIEYENREGIRIVILGTALIRCKCGHYNRVNPMEGVFSDEIRKASVTFAGVGG